MDGLYKSYRITALRALGYHDYTPRALVKKILDKSEIKDISVAKRVVIDLHAEGLVSEKRYGEDVLRSCENSYYGPRRIKQELVKKDFSPAFIERFEALDTDYAERLSRYIESHGIKPDKSDRAGYDRLIRSLIRLGYDYDTISGVLSRLPDDE